MEELYKLLKGGTKPWIDPQLLVFLEELEKGIEIPLPEIQIKETVKESPPKVPKYNTNILNIKNQILLEETMILDVQGPGELDHITIICDSDDFSVKIMINNPLNTQVLSYNDLVSVAQDISDVAAYQNDVGYLVAFQHIYFAKCLQISVIPNTTPLRIVQAFGKYRVLS